MTFPSIYATQNAAYEEGAILSTDPDRDLCILLADNPAAQRVYFQPTAIRGNRPLSAFTVSARVKFIRLAERDNNGRPACNYVELI